MCVPVSLLAVSPHPPSNVLQHTTHQRGAQTVRDTACKQRSLEGGRGREGEGGRGREGEGGREREGEGGRGRGRGRGREMEGEGGRGEREGRE